MGRIHLFELEDLKWYPHFMREAITDCLLSLYKLLDMYEPAFQKIYEVLKNTNTNTIIDCCSGSGGTNKQLREYLDKTDKRDTPIILTDKYPSVKMLKKLEKLYPNKFIVHEDSLDATKLPASLQGMRTFFSCFHHFTPDQAVKILQDAVNNNAPIAIFECARRHFINFVHAAFGPLYPPILIPFAKRITWSKFIFTYLLPIIPIAYTWDHIVSNLRVYSPRELQELIKQVNAPHYHWETGTLYSKKAMNQITYLIGHPT